MKIEAASEQHQSAYRLYFRHCREEGFDYYCELPDDADGWLSKVLQHADAEALPEGWVPCQTWFLLTDDGEIVGAARLREGETEVIQDEIGHIGFEVLSSWRGHGYGRVLLQYVQAMAAAPACGNWVLVCDAANIAGLRTIEACGGQRLEDMPQADGSVARRYSLASLASLIE
ncbi:GNAT family N-acetyltransferase [Chromobacterium alticapitis]|nr:GNAT family N-acetyltransferase [Chromobacterium alticapitis]